jgi:diaminopimelate decarboxylase
MKSSLAWSSSNNRVTPGDLVARFGSSLYVYDAEAVRQAFFDFQAAFPYQPLEIHYAIVCNKNRYLVRLLHRLGAGIHANTPGDAHAAIASGVPPHRIVYSGTNLNIQDFNYLLRLGIHFNLDSLDQLRDLARTRTREAVGLRFLIDDVEHPNRIGVTAPELGDALAIAQSARIRITGLHMYAEREYLERLLAGRLGGLRPRRGAKIWLLVTLESWLRMVFAAREGFEVTVNACSSARP